MCYNFERYKYLTLRRIIVINIYSINLTIVRVNKKKLRSKKNTQLIIIVLSEYNVIQIVC